MAGKGKGTAMVGWELERVGMEVEMVYMEALHMRSLLKKTEPRNGEEEGG